jgi:exonuclease III
LQETHTSEKIEVTWKNEWGKYDIYFSHGNTGSKGVAIVIPKLLDYKVNNVIRSQNGRYISVNITVNDDDFCLINCYAPNTDQPKEQLKWLGEIQQILQLNSEVNIIVGGDLNDVFIPQLDRYRCKPKAVETEYVKAWKTVCENLNLADIWRVVNPDKKKYTWRQGSSSTRLKQSRLDYWLASVHLFYDLQEVSIKASSRSDHSLIEINLYKNNTPERGPSFWRFNANLLKDKKYVDLTKQQIVDATENYSDIEDKGLKWDLIKMEVRSSTICFSKNKAKETSENIKEAMIQVDLLEKN